MFAYEAWASATQAEVYIGVPGATAATPPPLGRFVADQPVVTEQGSRNFVVLVHSVPDMRLTLLGPLPVLVSQGPVNATVSSSLLEIYGVGDNVSEAMDDWYAEVAREYFFLSEHEAELGGPLLDRWRAFSTHFADTIFQ